MEQAGVEPNSHTYTVLLHCLERRRKTFDGFQVSLQYQAPQSTYIMQSCCFFRYLHVLACYDVPSRVFLQIICVCRARKQPLQKISRCCY